MTGRRATTDVEPGDVALSVGMPDRVAPNGWQWLHLDLLARMATGHTPSRKHPEYWEGAIPWMSVGEARPHDGGTIHETSEHTNELGIANSAAVVLPPFTVCLSRTGSIGYTVLLGREMATSQGFVNWICGEALVPRFLQLLFLAERPFLYRISEGVAHTTIYFPEVKAFHVCVPPLGEQHRIVEAIEAHFSRLDSAVAALKRVQANLKRYRASVLKAACEGRLVPTEAELARKEGRDYEPASKLLERILNERRKRWEEQEWAKHVEKAKRKLAEQCRKNNGQDPPPHILEQDAKYGAYLPKGDIWKAQLPKEQPVDEPTDWASAPGWTWARLDTIADVKLGKMLSKAAHAPNLKRLTYLRNENVRWGSIDLSDLNAMGFKPHEIDRYQVATGDLLVCEGGEPGRAAVVTESSNGLMYQKALHRVRPYGAEVGSRWIQLCLEAFVFAGRVLPRYSETTIKHLPLEKITAVPIPLPPAAERQRIVAEVERRLSVVDELETAVAANLKRAERLRQAILKRAFEGRLVPTEHELAQAEGRSYETAEQLLARIRQQGQQVTNSLGKGSKSQRKSPMQSKQQRPKRALADVLRESKRPMKPEELLTSAGYDAETVDAFYLALRTEVRAGNIVESRTQTKGIVLQLGATK